MAKSTIPFDDDVDERLDAARRGKGSFSEVVRRLASGVQLSTFHGILSVETADELEMTFGRD